MILFAYYAKHPIVRASIQMQAEFISSKNLLATFYSTLYLYCPTVFLKMSYERLICHFSIFEYCFAFIGTTRTVLDWQFVQHTHYEFVNRSDLHWLSSTKRTESLTFHLESSDAICAEDLIASLALYRLICSSTQTDRAFHLFANI